MSASARTRVCLLALIVALTGSVGPTECAPPVGDTSAPQPPASLKLVAQPSYPGGGNTWYAIVILQATASAPAQAFDVDISFPPGIATQVMATGHAGFNDDIALASTGAPDLQNGRLLHVVDVRHGATSALAGTLNLAYVIVRVGSRIPIWVQARGDLARPDGKLFATTPSTRVRVLPPPL